MQCAEGWIEAFLLHFGVQLTRVRIAGGWGFDTPADVSGGNAWAAGIAALGGKADPRTGEVSVISVSFLCFRFSVLYFLRFLHSSPHCSCSSLCFRVSLQRML